MRRICGTLVAALAAMPVGAPSPDLAGIAHVAFQVNDVNKSRGFYGKLGFEQAFEFKDASGSTSVSYMKVNDRQFIELYQRASTGTAGFQHVCFEAGDIEALWREYQKRGLNTPAPQKARAGNLLFRLRSPEGQWIEFTQYLPGSLHFDDRGQHWGERRVSEHLVRVTTVVTQITREAAFYTDTLAFRRADQGGKIELRLPGNSGEEIELEPASSSARPGILFELGDQGKAADELGRRGLAVQTQGALISLTDPDGNVVAFTSHAHWQSTKP
jgi:catechol 2,3-dioxygenase-like lactoylglutathione lyase family enzyme